MSFSFTLESEADVGLFLSRLERGLAEAQAAEFLRGRGYRVESDKGHGWTSPRRLSRQCGRNANWLANLLSRGVQPPGLEIHRGGESRRITMVRATAEFHEWEKGRGYVMKR